MKMNIYLNWSGVLLARCLNATKHVTWTANSMLCPTKSVGQKHATPIRLAMTSILVIGLIILSGCESQPTEVEDYQQQAYLGAYLVNGEPVNQIFLQWVAPFYGYYELNSQGISDCEMIIFPLENRQPGDTLHLEQHSDPDSTWIYIPKAGETPLIPLSLMHYRIEVRKSSEGIDLWSETVVPSTFDLFVNGEAVDTVQLNTMTREDPNIMLNWSSSLNDSVGGYAMITRALTDIESVVPLDPEFEIGIDTVETAEVSLIQYWMCRYDQTAQPVPWMLFEWAGPYTVEFQAAALGYNDYVTSLFRASMGFPIEYANNINGGIGIFGGLSRKKFEVVMERVNN